MAAPANGHVAPACHELAAASAATTLQMSQLQRLGRAAPRNTALAISRKPQRLQRRRCGETREHDQRSSSLSKSRSPPAELPPMVAKSLRRPRLGCDISHVLRFALRQSSEKGHDRGPGLARPLVRVEAAAPVQIVVVEAP